MMDDFLATAWSRLTEQAGDWGRAALWAPVAPVPGWMAPGLALGGFLSLVLLAGMALVSFGLFLTALLAAQLVLVRVFGISVTIPVD